MAIWGHTLVHVEKSVTRRCWIVSTAHNDAAKRQVLTEVKWEHAFSTFPHAPDYSEAITTCQGHDETMLTLEEEDLVRDFLAGRITREVYEGTAPVAPEPDNVVSLKAFRKNRTR